MHAQIVLFDGFDPLDVIAPYEVLYAGGTASGGAVVTSQRRAISAATEHRP
jgi:putative intracellular protease/amidase